MGSEQGEAAEGVSQAPFGKEALSNPTLPPKPALTTQLSSHPLTLAVSPATATSMGEGGTKCAHGLGGSGSLRLSWSVGVSWGGAPGSLSLRWAGCIKPRPPCPQ